MSTADAKTPVAPSLDGPAPVIVIVRAPFYEEVVDGLTAGADRILHKASCEIHRIDVAGAFELPQAVGLAARGFPRADGFVVLGCVVRGETDHYAFICQSVMNGLLQVSLQYGLAMGTGLLTVDTLEQARTRSIEDGHNKGAEAAVAALLQVRCARRFPGPEDLRQSQGRGLPR